MSEREMSAVAAVVPAYNEGERIRPVLTVLGKTPSIREIIVIDDGSSDQSLREIVKQFPRVKFLRNDPNRGKGYSMERGVRSTDAPIIFFCDADLNGLTADIVEAIIRPVREGRYDMFIGVRENFAQRGVRFIALNSGERALRREFWEKLPAFYKYRFRIETGLNAFVKRTGKGFGSAVLPYQQMIKERKYGFWRGEWLRWRTNWDVSIAWLRIWFVEPFRHFR